MQGPSYGRTVYHARCCLVHLFNDRAIDTLVMAPLWVLDHLQASMSYRFTNLSLLEKTLIAVDSNSDDREGHRGMAQLGDSFMGTVMLCDGLERGLSRSECYFE